MARVVVHELEVVEIEEKQSAVLPPALHAPQLAAQAVHEASAVQQPGQRVVVGEPAELAFGLLAVADVFDLQHVVERLALLVATRVVDAATQIGLPSARR